VAKQSTAPGIELAPEGGEMPVEMLTATKKLDYHTK
jgi:hypothetical protein